MLSSEFISIHSKAFNFLSDSLRDKLIGLWTYYMTWLLLDTLAIYVQEEITHFI